MGTSSFKISYLFFVMNKLSNKATGNICNIHNRIRVAVEPILTEMSNIKIVFTIK